MTLQRRECGLIEVKASVDANGVGTFSGYGAIFGNVDAYGDVIQRGAFKRTLKEWDAKGKLPKMLLQHGGFSGNAEDLLPVGKWTSMEENARGLRVEGKLFGVEKTDLGRRLYESMKEGELDSMSIGYFVKQMIHGTKPEEPARTLLDIELIEVSLVTFPANSRAVITAVKGLTTEQKRDLEEALHDEGLSRKDCRIAVSLFQQSILRDAGDPSLTPRDEVVTDEAQAVLQSLKSLHEETWAAVLRESVQRTRVNHVYATGDQRVN